MNGVSNIQKGDNKVPIASFVFEDEEGSERQIGRLGESSIWSRCYIYNSDVTTLDTSDGVKFIIPFEDDEYGWAMMRESFMLIPYLMEEDGYSTFNLFNGVDIKFVVDTSGQDPINKIEIKVPDAEERGIPLDASGYTIKMCFLSLVWEGE